MQGNETRPGIRPSAKSTIYINCVTDDENGITLSEQEFVGDTEAEVKAQVESWVSTRFNAIVEIIKYGSEEIANG
jgi:hypothetical protein